MENCWQRDKSSESPYPFPCIPLRGEDSPPNYQQLFKWGCSSLVSEQEPRPVPSKQFRMITIPNSWFNIYMAIKYGVWSFPINSYFSHFMNHQLYKSKKVHYVFIHNNCVFGIAKVVEFLPDKTFKYWQSGEGVFYFGVISIKFLKIGRYKLQSGEGAREMSEELLDRIWKGLDESQMNLEEMRKFDEQEYERRMNWGYDQQFFTEEHAKLNSQFNTMQERYSALQSKKEGRSNHTSNPLTRSNPIKYKEKPIHP